MSLARPQHVQRPLRHVGQRIGLVRRHRIADAGLHVAPPAVIGAGEANQMRAPGVVARQPHRLHHGFGAGHVERDLVEAGNRAQPFDVVGDDGVVGAEHGPERMRALFGLGDALLVEVVAEDVDAVGAGQVVEDIAVDIGDGDAGRGLHEGAGAEMLAHQAAVLERHAVGFGELQVGDVLGRLRRHLPALGVTVLIDAGEAEEAVLALRGDIGRARRRSGRNRRYRIRNAAPAARPSWTFWNVRPASGAWPATAPAAPAIWGRSPRRRQSQRRTATESEGANPCHQR